MILFIGIAGITTHFMIHGVGHSPTTGVGDTPIMDGAHRTMDGVRRITDGEIHIMPGDIHIIHGDIIHRTGEEVITTGTMEITIRFTGILIITNTVTGEKVEPMFRVMI